MTEQEAIKEHTKECLNRITVIKKYVKNRSNVDKERCSSNIKILSTVIEALEKQIPKKPIHIEDDEIRNTDLYQCPSCDRRFLGKGIAVYCYHCGQKLDWSEEE